MVGVDAKLDIDAWLARIRACVTATPGVAAVIDPAGTDDYETWRKLREGWKGAPVILGDDLFDSNPHTVDQGTSEGWADGVVACLALTGTLKRVTDMAVVSASRQAKFVVRVSSGEVVDSNVADIVGCRLCRARVLTSCRRSAPDAGPSWSAHRWTTCMHIRSHGCRPSTRTRAPASC